MALVDLVDLAASKEIDDTDLMGCINFFVDKRYLVYEQGHQIVKLTALGTRSAAERAVRFRRASAPSTLEIGDDVRTNCFVNSRRSTECTASVRTNSQTES